MTWLHYSIQLAGGLVMAATGLVGAAVGPLEARLFGLGFVLMGGYLALAPWLSMGPASEALLLGGFCLAVIAWPVHWLRRRRM